LGGVAATASPAAARPLFKELGEETFIDEVAQTIQENFSQD
jgi:hypothetical protein